MQGQVAFDLAVLRAHLDQKFPRFVFHDRVFESLDDCKKANPLRVLPQYADLGLKPIITPNDSGTLPTAENGKAIFERKKIEATLYDEDDDEILFRMKA